MDVILDGYRAQRMLRSSSTSQVWEALRLADQRLVIAKVFAIEDRARPDGTAAANHARVDHEFDMIRRLEVPGVVRALALERSGDHLILLLEAHRGVDLGELIRRGPIAVSSFLDIALQITRILADVHEQRVLHRDIKPTNILIDPETGEVVLADFGISELLAGERGRINDRDIIEGTLPYMAPEQTGRTAREVDLRSDLYSLGATFYELLTGQRPFCAESPLELIHAHLARRPTPPQRLRPELPTLLSDMVMKLLEKAPERRYQSARGLWLDLCAMQAAMQNTTSEGRLGALELGRDDVPLALQLPHQIHGREPERASLRAAFERSITDRPQLVTIVGAAGVGKTMLIDALVEPVLGHRGFLARGRCSADSSAPLTAITGALAGLADQLLTLAPESLKHWRELLLRRLGSLAPVVAELAPSFRHVLGELPVDGSRTAHEIRNQVMLGCVRLLTCLGRADHPLVLVLDDVQWADRATLDLIEDLVDEDEAALLIVLAGREQAFEVGSELATLLVELQTRAHEPIRIELGALERAPLIQLIADMLSRPSEAVGSLAEIVARKTGSNPFFVGQLLLHLAERGLLRREQQGWTWDPDALEAAALPDDVLDMMTRKLAGLAEPLQRLLQAAAVIGSGFEVEALAGLLDLSSTSTSARLLELVDEGLVAPLDRTYLFGHERIREAAYASLEPRERARLHLKIGQALRRQLDPRALDQRVFEVVEHLDQGYRLGDPSAGELARLERAELVELAELNVRASQRAISSGAPRSAGAYLALAERVLAQLGEFPERGQALHGLYVAAEQAAVQVEVLDRRFDEASARVERLLARELEVEDVGKIADLRTWALLAAGRHESATRVAIATLRSLGVALPEWPTKRHMLVALVQLMHLAKPTTLARLRDLPPVRDPRMSAAMDILGRVSTTSYMASPEAFIVLIVAHARLLLRYGNHPSTPLVLVQIGMLVASAFDRQPRALEICEFAREFAEAESSRMSLYVRQATCFTQMWSRSFADLHAELEDVFERALEHGDRDLAESMWILRTMTAMFGGQHLRVVEALAETRVRWPESWNNESAASVGVLCRRLITGPAPEPGQTDPLGLLAGPWSGEPNLGLSANYKIVNAIVLAVFGRWAEVHAVLDGLCPKIERALGRIWYIAMARLLDGLSAAALAGQCEGRARRERLATLDRARRRFTRWNARGAGFVCHEAILRAERAALAGQLDAALHHFDRARKHAASLRNPMLEALVHERLAALMLDGGREGLALGPLLDARDRYRHWGAFAKVAELDRRWPELARRGSSTRDHSSAGSTSAGSSASDSTSSSTTSKAVDSATLLKASQMLSEDIRLEEVVVRIMDIALENAGAERGVLLLVEAGGLALAAETNAEGQTGMRLNQTTPLSAASLQVPTTIIRWVERTREPVVLTNASADSRFQSDPYLRDNAGLSVLCLPFVKRGRLVGVLYLENRLSAGSFVADRLELLRLLTAQAASALENAQLYGDLRTSEIRWRSLVEQLPDYVILVDRAGTIEYLNLGVDTRGVAAPQFDPTVLRVAEHRQRISLAMARVFDEGVRDQFEIHAHLPAGGTRWYSVRLAPIVVDDIIERAIVVATDISERKQAELQREQAELERQRLEGQTRQQQRLESIGTLASGVAHEINNPIQGIMNYAELIAESVGASEEVREFAGEIGVETERVTTIVRNLLAFSRQDHEQANERVGVREIIDGTLSLVRTVLRKDQITLELDIPADLPDIHCRRQQIQQVIMNLVTNARDAVNSRWPCYHVDKRISVRASCIEREGASWLQLSVEDRGGGVPAAVLPFIFDPFFTTKGRDQGTGLGLAVSHGIILEHGGRLVLDNHAGVGACFSIELRV